MRFTKEPSAALRRCLARRRIFGSHTIGAAFRAFPECTLRYLRKNVVPEEFCDDSLERLAGTLHSQRDFSRFDSIFQRRSLEEYLWFQSLRTENTRQERILAMAQLMRFPEEKHGKIRVYFKLKGKRK